ncbi:Uncharacterized protein HZ326_23034, partial [Fusarium oxysporum f. sp. albedinis]
MARKSRLPATCARSSPLTEPKPSTLDAPGVSFQRHYSEESEVLNLRCLSDLKKSVLTFPPGEIHFNFMLLLVFNVAVFFAKLAFAKKQPDNPTTSPTTPAHILVGFPKHISVANKVQGF